LLTAELFIFGFAAFQDDPVYLDSMVYASMLPLLAFLIFARRGRAPEIMANTADLAARIAIGGANRRRIVPLSMIKALHGAGNYAEFELNSGERVLDERKLADWAASLPPIFFRVHRSHIVNLEQTRAVLTLGAGKYEVEMTDHSRIPLSRSRAGPLRALIEASGVLPGAASAE
jgi:DNA-binding LytR/AlgR family response regulator